MSTTINKKICLLGEFGVGKTSLIQRFVFDRFSDDYLTTLGVKITEKLMPPLKKNRHMIQFRFLIWDIAGSEDGLVKHEGYWTGASGALIVTDLSRPDTITAAAHLIDHFLHLNAGAGIVIAGNKTDLIGNPLLHSSGESLKKLADNLSCPSILTSAKTGQHVEDAFLSLAHCLPE
ncbi:GTP-binding protein [bacterium]|nr:GTP-binding protein [bacterium]